MLITGGIDLSIPPAMGLSAILGTVFMKNGGNPFIAFLLMLLVGIVCRLINGIVIAYLKMIPFIVTLQMITYGACLWMAADGASGVAESFKEVILFKVGGLIPMPIIVMVLIMAVVQIYLKNTYLGRQLYLVGTNTKMADVSGVNSKAIIGFTYMICGVLAAVAGMVYIA